MRNAIIMLGCSALLASTPAPLSAQGDCSRATAKARQLDAERLRICRAEQQRELGGRKPAPNAVYFCDSPAYQNALVQWQRADQARRIACQRTTPR